jgi:hypothetical protein
MIWRKKNIRAEKFVIILIGIWTHDKHDFKRFIISSDLLYNGEKLKKNITINNKKKLIKILQKNRNLLGIQKKNC